MDLEQTRLMERRRGFHYLKGLLATALCFTTFAFGSLLVCLALFPLDLMPWERGKKQKLTRFLIHKLFGFFVRLMERVGILSLRVEGENLLAQPRSRLLIANHPSLIDVVVLISRLPDAVCIVKAEVQQSFSYRHIVRRAGYIINSSPEEFLDGCRRSLEQGRTVVVFPEGTRTVPGKALKFLRGASQVALRCRHSLTPVVIFSDSAALAKDRKWYHVPHDLPMEMTFRVLEDIGVERYLEGHEGISLSSRKLTRHLADYFHHQLTLSV